MKQFSLLIGLGLLASMSMAQPIPHRMAPPPQFQHRQFKNSEGAFMQRLNLTQAQKEQLKKEHDKALERILTADQKEKLAKFRQQEQAFKDSAQKRQDRKLKEQLGLSNEQVAKVRALQKEFKVKMTAIREDVNQTVQQQRDRTRELWQSQQKAWKEVLSPEQLEKYKGLLQKKMQKMRQHMPPQNRPMDQQNMGTPPCRQSIERASAARYSAPQPVLIIVSLPDYC